MFCCRNHILIRVGAVEVGITERSFRVAPNRACRSGYNLQAASQSCAIRAKAVLVGVRSEAGGVFEVATNPASNDQWVCPE